MGPAVRFLAPFILLSPVGRILKAALPDAAVSGFGRLLIVHIGFRVLPAGKCTQCLSGKVTSLDQMWGFGPVLPCTLTLWPGHKRPSQHETVKWWSKNEANFHMRDSSHVEGNQERMFAAEGPHKGMWIIKASERLMELGMMAYLYATA